MRNVTILILVSLSIANASGAEKAALRSELSALEFLVGWCWQGPFPGGKQLDTHCFESVFEGQHVRDRHAVTGGPSVYRGETVYSYDGKEGIITYVYWNSIGGVSTGTATPNGDGSISFPDESYTGTDGQRVTVSTAWRNIDATGYDSVTLETYENGEQRTRNTRFERRPFAVDPAGVD